MKNLARVFDEETYSHVYNRGVEKRVIFSDSQDYETFIKYLKEYLSAPADPKQVKKTFTVKGKTYQGTPHLPKNYFNKVELVAYALSSNHFHLLLHQKVSGELESFIRSLCTRYSIYFNKKYQRTGSLFDGPYRSVHVRDKTQLWHLVHYLNENHTEGYSTREEYMGQRKTPWISLHNVLSVFNKEKLEAGINEYKQFATKHPFDSSELLNDITLETREQKPAPVLSPTIEAKEENTETPPSEQTNKRQFGRFPELIAFSIFFLVLTTIGIRNIQASFSAPSHPQTGDSVEVGAGENNEIAQAPENTETTIPETASTPPISVVVLPTAKRINIRVTPAAESEIVGKAKAGDLYPLVEQANEDWYEIKVNDETNGFISSQYVSILNTTP